VQTHLDGRLTVGNTLYDANTTARIVGLNNTASTYALVVTNSTAGTNTTSAPALVVTNEQNVGIGTYSPGARLQVNGSGNTSATASILAVNSDNVTTFRVGNSGIVSANALISVTGLLSLYARENLTNGIAVIPNNNTTITSGIRTTFNISDNFVPTSGTGAFRVLTLNPTINQTGGANGITNGILIDPSITLAANWRSVQWNNSTGFGLYGEGTAPNRLNGILSLPSTSEASPGLQFNSNSAVGLYSSDVNNIGLISGDRKQLLLEKAATNLLVQSENIATTWIQLGGASGTTLTTNVATAPNGTMTADKIVSNSSSNFGIRQTLTGTFLAGRTYTFSLWVRTDSTCIIQLDINDAGASVKKLALTNNWVRYSTTFTFTSNTTNPFVDITFDNTLQNALNKHMYVWGMQFEESLNPT
ncbi:MAG: carbohydrate binding domain-containing protein, partial [Bacteroidota bacterium]